jgi:hypothetical protein
MENVSLWTTIDRTYADAACHNETDFGFYDRSALPTAARIRGILDVWYRRYPEEKRLALLKALQTDFWPPYPSCSCMSAFFGCTKMWKSILW